MAMKLVFAILLALAVSSCRATSTDAGPARAVAADQAVAELLAAQTSAYAVPATASGVSFTVAASMAATRWAKLNEAELRRWWLLWSTLCEQPGRIVEPYQDAQGKSANLFERSARDGFCVALAHRSARQLDEPRIVAFFSELAETTRSK